MIFSFHEKNHLLVCCSIITKHCFKIRLCSKIGELDYKLIIINHYTNNKLNTAQVDMVTPSHLGDCYASPDQKRQPWLIDTKMLRSRCYPCSDMYLRTLRTEFRVTVYIFNSDLQLVACKKIKCVFDVFPNFSLIITNMTWNTISFVLLELISIERII